METELTVKIDSITNLGEGVAKSDGMVIFVKDTCPEDVVKIQIIKQSKSYARGKVLEILKLSPYRVQPKCNMQKVCGACHLQFIDYNYQLKLKQQMVQDCMRDIESVEVLETIPSPQVFEYRHKIQYPISETKNSKRLLAGYYKQKSHEILNIKYCPIQPKICNDIIEYIRQNAGTFGVNGYVESKHTGLLRHVVIRNSNYNNTNLVVLVVNDNKISKNIKDLAKSIYKHIESVVGVCVNLNNKKTNLILTDKTTCICGQDYIEEKLCDYIFNIGANTFFQVNPQSAENIFKYVKDYIKNNFEKPTVLDAYAGIATFGIVMSDISKHVVSVEENAECIKIARDVLQKNNINNVELYSEDTAKFLDFAIKQDRKFDISIIDPPRKGCSEESLDRVLAITNKKIIYVSCNPQTLARDLKYLISKGAKVSQIQPFDMFCHTYHVECVTVIDV